MILSQSVEYALRAAALLATRGGESLTTRQIASAAHVPAGYLAKILQSLARAGLVNSQRGIGGGFALARPADAVTVLDVVNAVDPLQRIHTCPLGLPEHHENLCPLHRLLDEAVARTQASFAAVTLADLSSDPPAARPTCGTAEACACGTTGK